MSSRFIVSSVYSMNGRAKKTNAPYDMKRVVTLSDFDGFTNADAETGELITNRQGVGFSECELIVSNEFYPKLHAFFSNEFTLKRTPIVMDLETTMRSRGRNTETIIVDFADSFKAKHPALKDAA